MSQEIHLLTEIKEQLVAINARLEAVQRVLENDRSMMWKVLGLTIAGAFALVGIKLIFS